MLGRSLARVVAQSILQPGPPTASKSFSPPAERCSRWMRTEDLLISLVTRLLEALIRIGVEQVFSDFVRCYLPHMKEERIGKLSTPMTRQSVAQLIE